VASETRSACVTTNACGSPRRSRSQCVAATPVPSSSPEWHCHRGTAHGSLVKIDARPANVIHRNCDRPWAPPRIEVERDPAIFVGGSERLQPDHPHTAITKGPGRQASRELKKAGHALKARFFQAGEGNDAPHDAGSASRQPAWLPRDQSLVTEKCPDQRLFTVFDCLNPPHRRAVSQ